MPISPYADVLIVTISNLFPKGTPAVQGKVFYVKVRMVFNDYTDDHESVWGFAHLAVVAERNYVQVYASLTSRPSDFSHITDWCLISDHDSAWRDDGVRGALSAAYSLTQDLAVKSTGKPVNKLSPHIAVDDMTILDAPAGLFQNVARGKLRTEQLLPQ
jgi:hypothetical protein